MRLVKRERDKEELSYRYEGLPDSFSSSTRGSCIHSY